MRHNRIPLIAATLCALIAQPALAIGPTAPRAKRAALFAKARRVAAPARTFGIARARTAAPKTYAQRLGRAYAGAGLLLGAVTHQSMRLATQAKDAVGAEVARDFGIATVATFGTAAAVALAWEPIRLRQEYKRLLNGSGHAALYDGRSELQVFDADARKAGLTKNERRAGTVLVALKRNAEARARGRAEIKIGKNLLKLARGSVERYASVVGEAGKTMGNRSVFMKAEMPTLPEGRMGWRVSRPRREGTAYQPIKEAAGILGTHRAVGKDFLHFAQTALQAN